MKIDHIGIAVKSLAEAVKVYANAIGLKQSGYDQVDEQGVRVAMFEIGDSRIELLEPTRPDSPIEKFMAKRGEGIHHIAFAVDDIEAEMKRLKDAGFIWLNEKPVPGADNKLVCFLHPKNTNGVLIELCMEKS